MGADHEYIRDVILPEHERLMMQKWAPEYPNPRELGIRAEFVEMHRKVMKLKAALWDEVDTTNWREPVETILHELASHAFLALVDLHHGRAELRKKCVSCNEQHTYVIGCELWPGNLKRVD